MYVILYLILQAAIQLNQTPTLREKAILLVKLMQYVEKRFADDSELQAQFLELVNYIYRLEIKLTRCFMYFVFFCV